MGKGMISNENSISAANFRHRFTLIIGEVNTGKTTLTQNILDALSQMGGGTVAVVDLAPHIVSYDLKDGTAGIGGTLKPAEDDRLRYYHCPIHAPRLQGKDELEALRLADENAQLIESLFEQALKRKVDALFVNDCSLYLQAGESGKLIRWIGSAETAIVNGYYGKTLGRGILSKREREGMDELIRRCDRVIRLTGDRADHAVE